MRSPIPRVLNLLGAAVVATALLAVLGFGYGPVPALGAALDPGRGAWISAQAGEPVRSQTLTIPGLRHPVTVTFSAAGTASVQAQTMYDEFLAQGYVEARFRLTEMDEERRLGEGRLSQLAGPSALSSDEFELRLGLLRTAQAEWARMPKVGPAAQALRAYAQGVNDDIAQDRASGQWPATVTLAGVYPGPWTPVDSLVIQGELTQELDFTLTPLDYALLEGSLGAQRTMDWFPVIAPNRQTPYDPGPYSYQGITPVAPDAASSTTVHLSAGTGQTDTGSTRRSDISGNSAAAAGLLAQLRQLKLGQVHEYPDSNSWAANGPAVSATATGDAKAMLAGDPHLPQTIPSVWYQIALDAPGYDVTGISVPGVPGVLLGHNQHIAWSLTNAQNLATLFYDEDVRGDEYLWDGMWRKVTVVHYQIPVRGQGPVNLTVDVTVHGPIMTQAGQTTSVDWMGNVPSPNLQVMLEVGQASDFAQFQAALAGWVAPSQNFVYADTSGNIGAITAGWFPQVGRGSQAAVTAATNRCQPWLPMPGTGSCDVVGVIPYDAQPHTYDPANHAIATANQRQVTAAYPYFIGTSASFDPGYRAATIYQGLQVGLDDPATFAALQMSLKDQLAARLVPSLLTAIASENLSSAQRSVVNLLRTWNDRMAADSPAASVWWTFLGDYLNDTFGPWWVTDKVPVSKNSPGLAVGPDQFSLDADLEAWTSDDPSNPVFSLPDGQRRTAPEVMREAFGQAAAHLAATLGPDPASWQWRKLNAREFPALSGASGLGYGPRPAGGDSWTPDAGYDPPLATDGPTWRMIDLLGGTSSPGGSFGGPGGAGGSGAIWGEGIYPGGQSENPASPWYENEIPLWWDGQYLPIPEPGAAAGTIEWRLSGD